MIDEEIFPMPIAALTDMRERGEETHAEIGRSFNVSGWTISRLR